jgi:hypothetical protein
MENPVACFSPANFDMVYNFVVQATRDAPNGYMLYKGYEIYAGEPSSLSFKDNGYTLARIDKNRAVFSLAKRQKDGEQIVKKINQIFCELLAAAGKQS